MRARGRALAAAAESTVRSGASGIRVADAAPQGLAGWGKLSVPSMAAMRGKGVDRWGLRQAEGVPAPRR